MITSFRSEPYSEIYCKSTSFPRSVYISGAALYGKNLLSFNSQTWLFLVYFVLIVMFDALVGWTSFPRAPRILGFDAVIRDKWE